MSDVLWTPLVHIKYTFKNKCVLLKVAVDAAYRRCGHNVHIFLPKFETKYENRKNEKILGSIGENIRNVFQLGLIL